MYCDRCETDKPRRGSYITAAGQAVCADCLRAGIRQYQMMPIKRRKYVVPQPVEEELPRYMLKCDKCGRAKHKVVFDYTRLGNVCKKCSARMSRRAAAEPIDGQLETAVYVLKKFKELG